MDQAPKNKHVPVEYVTEYKKVVRNSIDGVTKGAIRRLARKGGIKRISGTVHKCTQHALEEFLHNIVTDAIYYTEYGRRKTVSTKDVLQSLKRNGHTMYGYGPSEPKIAPTRKREHSVDNDNDASPLESSSPEIKLNEDASPLESSSPEIELTEDEKTVEIKRPKPKPSLSPEF